jgi:hypothetical protein
MAEAFTLVLFRVTLVTATGKKDSTCTASRTARHHHGSFIDLNLVYFCILKIFKKLNFFIFLNYFNILYQK